MGPAPLGCCEAQKRTCGTKCGARVTPPALPLASSVTLGAFNLTEPQVLIYERGTT